MTTDYDYYDYWIQLYWLQLVSAVTEEPIEIHDTWKVWFPHKNKENDDSNDNDDDDCDDDDITMTSTMKIMTIKDLKDHLKTTHLQLQVFRPCFSKYWKRWFPSTPVWTGLDTHRLSEDSCLQTWRNLSGLCRLFCRIPTSQFSLNNCSEEFLWTQINDIGFILPSRPSLVAHHPVSFSSLIRWVFPQWKFIEFFLLFLLGSLISISMGAFV